MRVSEPSTIPGEMNEAMLGFLHAVRNPLAVIRSTAQVAQRLTAGSSPVTGYLDSIVVQVDRVELALQGLMRLARLEASPPGEVSVVDAVGQAVGRLREQAAARGVALGLCPGPDRRAHIGLEQLELALSELLDNAIRFSPPGSRVSVSWSAEGPGAILLHVDDDGDGVAPEHVESVLRPFFTTDRTRLGLGLALVERVCRLAGGELRWQNRSAGGCRLTMVLPASGE
jgi:signal transduction histidine kinase